MLYLKIENGLIMRVFRLIHSKKTAPYIVIMLYVNS